MAKTAMLDEFTIDQLLEAVESKKRARLDDLRTRRAELVEALKSVEADIARITGQPAVRTAGAPRGPRGARGPSMSSLILKALASSDSKEVAMSDLTEQLKGHTSSDRPNIIISQALVRLKKDALVESAGRGMYKLTATGRKRANED